MLQRIGFIFRINRSDLPGKPDIVLAKYKTLIFVHGCFWHGHSDCKNFRIPKSNEEFWRNKINNNITRDEMNIKKLESLGWRVQIIWECQIRSLSNIANIISKIKNMEINGE